MKQHLENYVTCNHCSTQCAVLNTDILLLFAFFELSDLTESQNETVHFFRKSLRLSYNEQLWYRIWLLKNPS